MRGLAALAVVVALVAAAPAPASILIAKGAKSPRLRVDARGNAEVSWRDARGRHSVVVRTNGNVAKGKLKGRDVSKPGGIGVPLSVSVRLAGSRFYALQEWQVTGKGAAELRFSRWTGNQPAISAGLSGEFLRGSVSFHGAGMYGKGVTVYIDCNDCAVSKGAWRRLGGIKPQGPHGTFDVILRPSWIGTLYRVTAVGKNAGWTLAPDARVSVTPLG